MATLNGTNGNDTLVGTTGSDVFNGSNGNDVYDGNDPGANAGRNFLNYTLLTGSISVTFQTATSATISKNSGGFDYINNISDIRGTNGSDRFVGPTDASGIYTLGNSVLFHGGAGNDTINGQGNNLVHAVYYDSPSAVNVDLSAGVAQDGWGGTDVLINVTSVNLSNFDDTVKGGDGGAAKNEWFFVNDAGSHHIDGQAAASSYRYTGNGSVKVDLQAKPNAVD